MAKHFDKLKNRNHTEWPNSNNTGRGTMPLEEPVSKFSTRKGDMLIKPDINNNTFICMGRDRNPFGPPRSRVPHGSEEDPNNPKAGSSEVSGFSDRMGAGAIDIVVGHGAPFALEKSLHDYFPQGLPPLYKTRIPNGLANIKLSNGSPHPGYILDAARIYMSQMCQVDDYFGIKKVNVPVKPKKPSTKAKNDENPHSAIMMKADKLRFHSRRDIYIVAGGDPLTSKDSNNYEIYESGKIHLVAKNQSDPNVRKTSMAVRHTELRECLLSMCQSIQDVLELINNFAIWQKQVNHTFANRIFGTAVGMTTCDPFGQAMEQIANIANMKDLLQIHVMKTYNIPSIRFNYLTDGAAKEICSRHVTLN